jgi:N-acetylmuramoyl-L-alanine amidase
MDVKDRNILMIGIVATALYYMNRIKIWDKVEELARHASKMYAKRSTHSIKKIIVHHSATTSGSAEAYARHHVQNLGWPGIGYHFVIEKNGQVKQTNDLDTVSYHTSGQNTGSVGIVMTGNFDIQKPTEAQERSLAQLINHLRRTLGSGLKVHGHREFSSKSCPGKNVDLKKFNT